MVFADIIYIPMLNWVSNSNSNSDSNMPIPLKKFCQVGESHNILYADNLNSDDELGVKFQFLPIP
jgi:hypothetical protein